MSSALQHTPSSERAPLLRAASGVHTDASEDISATAEIPDMDNPTPLDKRVMFLLSFTRVCEPLAFAILFPFVNSMVEHTGKIPPEEVGFYVGAIESMFSFSQMLFLVPWGWAADRFGRKPVLLVSLVGACASTLMFGLSSKVWHMIAARAIAGLFGGNAVVVRTLFAEYSDKSNQARAFSFFAFATNLGIFLGPVIGGTFAEPVRQFPGTIGRLRLLQAYPYLLPCFITASYIAISFVLCLFFLQEPAHRERDAKLPIRKLFNGTLARVMLVYGLVQFLGIANTALLPLYAYTPVALGGLAFTPAQIALLIAIAGASQAVWLLVVMPPLDRRLGTRRLLRICHAVWPLGFLAPIGANLLARAGATGAEYALLAVLMTIGSGVAIAFTSVQLLVNDAAPPAALASVNGFALTLTALVRSATPAAMTSLFALGVERNILHRYLAWGVLATVAIVAFGLSALTPVDPAKEVRREVAEEQEELDGEA